MPLNFPNRPALSASKEREPPMSTELDELVRLPAAAATDRMSLVEAESDISVNDDGNDDEAFQQNPVMIRMGRRKNAKSNGDFEPMSLDSSPPRPLAGKHTKPQLLDELMDTESEDEGRGESENEENQLEPTGNSELVTLSPGEATVGSSSSNLVPLDPELHVLSNIEHRIKAELVYKWVIGDWSEAERLKKAYSPIFDIGGHLWRILMFPQGNNSEFLALYLDNTEPKQPDESGKPWSCCAQFALTVMNPIDSSIRVYRETNHRFNDAESDWGFTHFMKLSALHSYISTELPSVPSRPPSPKSLVANNSLVVYAHVRVVSDSTGNLWHNFINYDSKRETGFVGLKNQGATCYMNSLLQSLFFLDYFRKATFQIPTDKDEDPKKSIVLALQKLFYQLQTCASSPSTTELTKSFGWDSYESFLQRDVQEFSRKLQESLEVKMKGTRAEGALDKLFMGQTRRFVQCLHVDYESSGTESFYDIPLSVKDMKDVEESFASFTATEILEGENKYRAEGYGLQEARIGVVFTKFPPVLHLQLKRFEYDMMRDMTVKVNDRYEFPLTMDLGHFMADDAADRDEQVYHLYGVLVHSGDVGGGHYYAFMRQHSTGKWLKFDDDRVIYVTEKEAMNDNFGGDYEPSQTSTGGLTTRNQAEKESKLSSKAAAIKRFTNAYMLVYIREKDIPEVLKPLEEADIPKHLVDICTKERKDEEARRLEKQHSHLFMNIKIVTDDYLKENSGSDLIEGFLEMETVKAESALPSIRLKKTDTVTALKAYVFEHHQIPMESQRYWAFSNRYSSSKRPSRPIVGKDEDMELRELIDRSGDCILYLEIGFPESPLPNLVKSSVLLFAKYFDIVTSRLQLVTHLIADESRPVAELVPLLKESAKLPSPSGPLLLYEEIKSYEVQSLALNKLIVEYNLQHGDIVIFQLENLPKHAKAPSVSSIPEYYEFMGNRVVVTFKPKPPLSADSMGAYGGRSSLVAEMDKENLDQGAGPEFAIELSRMMSYDDVAGKVGSHLKIEPMNLRFTTHDPILGTAKHTPLKYQPTSLITDMLPRTYYMNNADVIYYEMLPISIVEMESKRALQIHYFKGQEEMIETVLVPFTGSVDDALAGIKDRSFLSGGDMQIRMRLLEVNNSRITKEYGEKDSIAMVGEYSTLYLEKIPGEELSPSNKSIRAFHFHKDLKHAYGVPFKLALFAGETFKVTKQRLCAKLAVPEKEWSKVQFAIVSNAKSPAYIDDSSSEDLVLYDLGWSLGEQLGLDHPDRQARANRSNSSLVEKAIKIN